MDLNEKIEERKKLWSNLSVLEKKFENNKTKRCLCTIAFYAFVYTVLGFKFLIKDTDIWEYVGIFVASVFLAGVTFFVNSVIFSQLINKGNAEKDIIDKMQKELSKKDEEIEFLRRNNK